MESRYTSLTADLPEEESELLQAHLHDLGVSGLEVRDSEAPPMPGVRGPTEGEAIVVAFFASEEEATRAHAELQEAFPRARLALEAVQNQDWSTAWRSLIRSVTVGRLWVGPPWEEAQAPREKIRIVIEPKMAFGTGDHPTTSLCLEAVDTFLASRPGASVLDVGTGTGVLAIAAKKLGAGRTLGIDNDPTSVTLALENAQLNQTPSVELSGQGLEDILGTFDLVVANILANTLVEMAPALAPKVKQQLVLAGVLAPQEEDVRRAYEAQGLIPLPTARSGDWVRLSFQRA
jgi:ribosomal protein L11 methyltransferase